MEIKETEKLCIITPLSTKLNKRESNRLFETLKAEIKGTAIDLSYVEECTIDFIEGLKEICKTKQVGIFNIPSDIFVLFNIMKLDKLASLYVSELDFEEESRRLINRQFSIV